MKANTTCTIPPAFDDFCRYDSCGWSLRAQADCETRGATKPTPWGHECQVPGDFDDDLDGKGPYWRPSPYCRT
jgi:hypothetical protein